MYRTQSTDLHGKGVDANGSRAILVDPGGHVYNQSMNNIKTKPS